MRSGLAGFVRFGSLPASGFAFGSRSLIPVSRRLLSTTTEESSSSSSAPPPPFTEAPKKRRRSFWLSPIGVLGIGGGVLFGYLMATYVKNGITRLYCLQVENSCMTKLDELHKDAVQNGLLYVHTKLAHRILEDVRVTSDMGTLRFQPESLRIVPLLKENRNFLTFNVYGTKRVGSVNAVLSKSVVKGWIVYKVKPRAKKKKKKKKVGAKGKKKKSRLRK
jgi:hypothetical protein